MIFQHGLPTHQPHLLHLLPLHPLRHIHMCSIETDAVKEKNWVLKQRSQLSGLCYIHGPDVLQHYLVSMNSEEEVGMIDISKMIRESFTPIELEKHIFEEDGGNSHTMLKRILEKDSMIIASSLSLFSDYIKQYGPGLVSCFKVHQDFTNEDVHSHSGEPVGKILGLHSMA